MASPTTAFLGRRIWEHDANFETVVNSLDEVTPPPTQQQDETFGIHGPTLIDDNEGQIYDDWSGVLATSKYANIHANLHESQVGLESDFESADEADLVDLVPAVPPSEILENLRESLKQNKDGRLKDKQGSPPTTLMQRTSKIGGHGNLRR